MSEIQDDTRALRNTLGRFATGVTIVTAIYPVKVANSITPLDAISRD